MTKFVKNNMDTIQNISSLLKNLSLNSNILVSISYILKESEMEKHRVAIWDREINCI